MAHNERWNAALSSPVVAMNIASAYPARFDPDQDILCADFRLRNLANVEKSSVLEDKGLHKKKDNL